MPSSHRDSPHFVPMLLFKKIVAYCFKLIKYLHQMFSIHPPLLVSIFLFSWIDHTWYGYWLNQSLLFVSPSSLYTRNNFLLISIMHHSLLFMYITNRVIHESVCILSLLFLQWSQLIRNLHPTAYFLSLIAPFPSTPVSFKFRHWPRAFESPFSLCDSRVMTIWLARNFYLIIFTFVALSFPFNILFSFLK